MRLVTTLLGIILCALCFNCVSARNKKSKSVTTLLDAKWKAVPLVLEAAEHLAEDNVDFYWSFIDTICDMKPALVEIENDRQRYNKIIEQASKLLTPSKISVLKLALSLHIYSPKIQMFSQMAVERGIPSCPVVVDVGGDLTCDINELRDLIKKNSADPSKKIDVFRVDTHYPGSENKSVPTILYGELGTSGFGKFHKVLKQYAVDEKIDYIVRHYVFKQSEKRQRLSGYGVELQMKSTEYKVQDDAQIHEDSTSEETSQEDEDVEVEGFDFAKLK